MTDFLCMLKSNVKEIVSLLIIFEIIKDNAVKKKKII